MAGAYQQLNMTLSGRLPSRVFAERRSAVAELPGLVQHHTFDLQVIAVTRQRANGNMQQIDSLLATRADPRARRVAPECAPGLGTG